jgi:type II secretory ATPase GspE/PulE/Tfp pilus assembly ATPase PilB-like protein
MRRLCSHCKKAVAAKPEMLEPFGEAANHLEGEEIFEPGGCSECNNLGYRGRVGTYEVLSFESPRIKELILTGASVQELFALAKEETGARSLVENGLIKVSRGETSLEEVMRVAL